LAAAYVLSNARQYGIVLWPEDPDWTRIPVNRPVDLNLLAAEAGVDPAILKMANRELNYYITPPGNYLLKVQAQDVARVNTALARGLPLINYYIHTIRSGDTLLALAIHYGISVDQITAMNPGVQARNLRIGSTLMIPAIREAPSMPPATGNNLNFSGTYQVKRGDSLWSIAQAHGVTPEALAEANGMALNDILREGRVLKTPIR
jgi:membrane-bound lytic murein transglycosylase D